MAKEETCINLNDVKEEKKTERFDKFIIVQEKLVKLQEKKVELAAASKDTKMLTMRMDELDDDVALIVRIIRVKMLKRLAAEMKAAKETDGEEDPAAD